MFQTKLGSVIRCLTRQSHQAWQCQFSSSSTNSQKVLVETGNDRISVVSLNRPPVNSLNLEFMEDIIAALEMIPGVGSLRSLNSMGSSQPSYTLDQRFRREESSHSISSGLSLGIVSKSFIFQFLARFLKDVYISELRP